MPEVLQIVSPFSIQRAQGMPDARCTRGLVSKCAQKVRPRAYRAAESIRHPLRSGFTAYSVLSPENGSFASVAPWEIERLPEALTPAPRRQDHTPLPYASCTFAWHTPRPPHPVPRSLRSRAPLLPGGTPRFVPVIWGSCKQKYCPSD